MWVSDGGVIKMAGELGPTFSYIMALLMFASVTSSIAQTPQEEEESVLFMQHAPP